MVSPEHSNAESVTTSRWYRILWILGICLTAVPHIASCYQEQAEIAERAKQDRLRQQKRAEEAGKEMKKRLLNGTASEVEVILSGLTVEEYEAYKASLKATQDSPDAAIAKPGDNDSKPFLDDQSTPPGRGET